MRSDERTVGGGGGGGGGAPAAGLPRVRVAVLGSPRVGKSALIVRYLTRRFIGEYHSNTDLLYRQTVPVGGAPVELEVIDVSGGQADFPTQQVQWADGVLLVYSVTERASFEHAAALLSTLRRRRGAAGSQPLALVGNKTDLDHLRQVKRSEGEAVSAASGANFGEASVAEAECSGEAFRVVDRLLAECRRRASPPPRMRKFSVSKMLGGLIGSGPAAAAPVRSGSVEVCPRPPAPPPPPPPPPACEPRPPPR